MTYILTDAALQIDFSISNRGQQALPYSLGGHWSFALEDNIENYTLQFDKPVALDREVLDGAYISGNTKKLANRNTHCCSHNLTENLKYDRIKYNISQTGEMYDYIRRNQDGAVL